MTESSTEYVRLVLFSVFCFFSFPQCASIPPAQPGKSRQPTQLHPFSSRQGSSFWIKLHSVFLFLCCILLFVSLSYFIIHFSSFFFHVFWLAVWDCLSPSAFIELWCISYAFIRSFMCRTLASRESFCWHCWLYSFFFSHFLWLAPLLCACRIAKERKES